MDCFSFFPLFCCVDSTLCFLHKTKFAPRDTNRRRITSLSYKKKKNPEKQVQVKNKKQVILAWVSAIKLQTQSCVCQREHEEHRVWDRSHIHTQWFPWCPAGGRLSSSSSSSSSTFCFLLTIRGSNEMHHSAGKWEASPWQAGRRHSWRETGRGLPASCSDQSAGGKEISVFQMILETKQVLNGTCDLLMLQLERLWSSEDVGFMSQMKPSSGLTLDQPPRVLPLYPQLWLAVCLVRGGTFLGVTYFKNKEWKFCHLC